MDWLKREITRRGITQAELGRVLGLSESIMSKVMNGTRKLSSTEADAIRRYLGYRLPGDTDDPRWCGIDRAIAKLSEEQERALSLYLEALTGDQIEPRPEATQAN